MVLDLIVVGAGPAGISLAVEARTAGLERIIVLEKAEAHSWTIRKLYPESKPVLANYKGHAAVCRGVLCITDTSKQGTLTYLDRAIEDHELDIRYDDGVAWISSSDDGNLVVRTDAGAEYTAPVLVVAIGIFGKPNKPDYRIPVSLRSRVHYDVTSQEYRDQDTLVVGGGDSASEYCQFLAQEGNRVVLSYRRSEFTRMMPINLESLEALETRRDVAILRASNIVAMEDEEGFPMAVFAEEGTPDLVVDHVFYALGGAAPRDFLAQVGIAFDGAAPVVTDGYETTVPGLYLVGDLVAGSRGGGSIITAFNSAHDAWQAIAAGPRSPLN